MSLFEQYGNSPINNNGMLHEDIHDKRVISSELLKRSKNCLVSLVKEDNAELYTNQTAKIYYTGKKFPATIALDKLYYFMPYLKKKGIRDLYFIRIARVGTRKEGLPDNDLKDFRLVFEIEFVGQLFENYKPIDLKIWRTFTESTIEELLQS